MIPLPVRAQASGVTLGQCYEWARAQSEDLKIRSEDIRRAQARARGAIGSALPQLDFKLTSTWQQPSGVEKLQAKGFAGFVEKNQVESKFTAEQALFSGLREFSAQAGFERETERDRLRFERAERELYERTAEAFFAAIGHETNRANTGAAHALSEDRLKELRGFLRLGKARESEVFSARAQAAALKGQLDQIDGDAFSARQELSYLTGHDLSAVPLIDESPLPGEPPPVNDLIERARERTDIRAQREDVAAQKMRIRYERGSYWPTLDLTGNYYTERATFLKDIDWDVILDVGVPLNRGGTVSSAVKEAKSAYQQSLLALQQMERWVVYAVRKNHGELAAALREVQSMEAAAQAARQSYESLRKEYRLGLVTNLEVLQALDQLVTQQNAAASARIKAKRLFVQLNVATEQLP